MARHKEYTEAWLKKEAKALLKYAHDTDMPFEKEFASRRGYSSQRISEFANKSEEFSEALKKMKDLQEIKIVKAAMERKINITFAIFTLKNVAGWRDIPIINTSEDRGLTLVDIVKSVTGKSRVENNDKGPIAENANMLAYDDIQIL